MAIQQSPSPSADLFFSRGVSYMALGNYAQAKADFEQALRVRPNFAAAQTKLAECRRALGIGSAVVVRCGRRQFTVPYLDTFAAGAVKTPIDVIVPALTDHVTAGLPVFDTTAEN